MIDDNWLDVYADENAIKKSKMKYTMNKSEKLRLIIETNYPGMMIRSLDELGEKERRSD